ncbi:MAG TPA: hypothetical protein VF736_20430 [Pyrinomonadaceae bacterium]|jgi:hypothetical protein
MVVASLSLLLAFAPACRAFEWAYEEVGRFTSPDGVVDAVWVRGSGGATTGFVYDLYVVPRGMKFDKDATSFKHAVFSGDHFEDLQIVWREPKLLEVRFKHARVLNYSNYWRYWNPDNPEEDRHYVVETRLAPLAEGSTLPPEDRQ